VTRAASVDGLVLRFSELILTDAFISWEALIAKLGARYQRMLLRQWYRLLGSAQILGNPIALFDSLGGGVIEFFRAPADGFLTDGLWGLGYGLKMGMQALVAGAVGGAFEYVNRLTGTFVKILESMSGVHVSSGSGGDASTSQSKAEAATNLSKDVKNALAGAVLKPYRGAREHGAYGFGKGIVTGAGTVVATMLALPLGAIHFLAGRAAVAIKPEARALAKARAAGTLDAGEIRRPRQFGTHGQMVEYGPGSVLAEHQTALDTSAAKKLQQAFRLWQARGEGRRQHGGLAEHVGSIAQAALHANAVKTSKGKRSKAAAKRSKEVGKPTGRRLSAVLLRLCGCGQSAGRDSTIEVAV